MVGMDPSHFARSTLLTYMMFRRGRLTGAVGDVNNIVSARGSERFDDSSLLKRLVLIHNSSESVSEMDNAYNAFPPDSCCTWK